MGFDGVKCDTCAKGFSGEKCEKCNDGFYGYPNCQGRVFFLYSSSGFLGINVTFMRSHDAETNGMP